MPQPSVDCRCARVLAQWFLRRPDRTNAASATPASARDCGSGTELDDLTKYTPVARLPPTLASPKPDQSCVKAVGPQVSTLIQARTPFAYVSSTKPSEPVVPKTPAVLPR